MLDCLSSGRKLDIIARYPCKPYTLTSRRLTVTIAPYKVRRLPSASTTYVHRTNGPSSSRKQHPPDSIADSTQKQTINKRTNHNRPMLAPYLTRHLFNLPGRACQWISFLLTFLRCCLRAEDVSRSVEEKRSKSGNAAGTVVKEGLRLVRYETGDRGHPLSLKVTPTQCCT
jgi:hypothetical protein